MLKTLRPAVLALLLLGSVAQAAEPEMPPLSDPPSRKLLAGKFVWADLVTDDVSSVKTFYTLLFGLEWKELRPAPAAYGLLMLDGLPVAGVAYHEAPGVETPYGRWVHYMSVDNVARAERVVADRGGRTVLTRRSLERRGEFAVVMGPDQALVGLMHSSTGDPDDYRAEQGEWLWRELYTADPAASAKLYEAICQCEIFPREDRENTFLIASQDFLRGSINSLQDTKETSAGWLGYVQVDDVAATIEKVTALGGKVVFAPSPDVIDGRLAIISDPVGAYLGLVSWDYADNNGEGAE
ncbi:MAG: hypothetical protein MUP90_15405 [Gammaproteobacteria bacterium]|nr:hypothetical protein [Gammaproteobacteria bacterium]